MAVDAATAIAGPILDADAWRRLERLSRQLSRRRDEADDLLQDVMLAALEAGRCDEPWLQGVMRKRAAFVARSAVRRVRRETMACDMSGTAPDAGEADGPPRGGAGGPAMVVLLARLPPASRKVLLLALHGLGAGEIQWLLRTSQVAFRQRVATIRREFRRLPSALRDEIVATGAGASRSLQIDPRFGLRRRRLLAAARATSSAGGHDPDGHLLLFRSRAHVPVPPGN